MKTIISFGEILWDIFGNEKKLGGAPFNLAAHFTRLGGKALMVSAVGRDELGNDALSAIRNMGMPSDGVAIGDYPTGSCIVTLRDGKPSYELIRDVAYDHIECDSVEGSFDAICFGTLASRGEVSRSSLLSLIKKTNAKEVFFDVNIRQSFYSMPLIEELLSYTTVLKVSREEMGVFGSGDEKAISDRLFERFAKLRVIAVTLDSDGAALFVRGSKQIYSHKPQGKVVSTVGAGDSFSACLLYNLLSEEDAVTCLERAVTLSDFVVTQLGAIPDYPPELLARIV